MFAGLVLKIDNFFFDCVMQRILGLYNTPQPGLRDINSVFGNGNGVVHENASST